MNKTYKTVWNQATRTWTVASELAKSKTKSAGGKAAATVASATMVIVGVAGIATMAAPVGALAAEQAVFNDGTGNACTAINSDGTTSSVSATAACAAQIGTGAASTAGLGSGLNFASNANGAFVNGGLEVFGTGVAAGSPAAYIHGELSLFSGPGMTGAANKIVGVAAGTLAAGSTDAVNADQLYATNTNVTSLTTTLNGITSGGGMKYFHSNSTLADSSATGVEAMAIGGNAQASSTNAIAVGSQSTSTGQGSVAIGVGATASGSTLGAIAIGGLDQSAAHLGTVASSYGSIAIGSGTTTVGSGTGNIAMGTGASAGSASNVVRALAIGGGATASGGFDTALGPNATSTARYATALGSAALASGQSALALGGGGGTGAGAVASGVSAIALGGGLVPGTGAVSSGASAIAVGVSSTSAGTSSLALGANAKASTDNSVALGAGSTTTANLATSGYNPGSAAVSGTASVANGEVSVGSSTKERRVTNLAAGSAATDAVNVSQLQSENAKLDQEGTTTASALGGGATYDASTGKISNPSYSVGSNTYNNVGAALTDLAGQTAAAVKYDSASKDTITLAGTAGTTITNVKAGSIAAGSTDAVNADQLYATNTNVTSLTTTLNGITSGGGMKYFHSNSTLADSSATGADAVAIGGNALASSAGVVSVGAGSSGSYGGSVALGSGATAVGGAVSGGEVGAVAIGGAGTGSSGTAGASAVGSGSIAISGGAQTLGTGSNNIAIGRGAKAGDATANTSNNIGFGYNAAASGAFAQAMGYSATSSGQSGAAIGSFTMASGQSAVAIGGGGPGAGANASGTSAVAVGVGSKSAGTSSLALGASANASTNNSVALGASSTTTANLATSGYNPGSAAVSGTASVANGEVSVGSSTKERRVTNLAAGSAATDAVNVSQLQSENAKLDQEGTTTASALGGGATYDASTGKISNPSYSVGSNTYNNVGAALTDLAGQTAAAVKYDSASKDAITLAGTAGTTLTNLKAGSIAAGSTDAVTGDQLNTTNANVTANTTAIAGLDTRVTQNATDIGSLNTNVASNTASIAGLDTRVTQNTTDIASLNTDVASNASDLASAQAQLNALDGAAVKYDSASKDTITLAGTSGTTITNVKGGSIAAGSTDAINGDQLNTTNTNVTANTTAIAGLDTRVTQNTTDIGSLNTNVASNTASIAGLDTRVTQNTTDIASLNTDVSSNASDLASAQAQLNALDGAAVKYDSASKDTITLAGTAGTAITNVKAGSIAAGSMDAVTGDQLNTTNTNVTANTTAIADLDTRVTQNATDIGSLNTNVAANTASIVGLDTRVTQNTTDIASLNTDVSSNATDLASAQAQLNALDGAAVKYDSASKDTITLAGTSGTTITNVKAGSIAAGSTDAVTGDQLNTTNANVTVNTTAIAGLDTRVTQNATDIGSLNTNVAANTTAIAGLDTRVTQNTTDIASLNTDVSSNANDVASAQAQLNALDGAAVKYDSASKDLITLAGTSGTTITNVKAGSIAAGSTDAVNGDQLNTTNTNVASNTTAVSGLDTRVTQNTTDIASLNTDVASNATDLASAQAQLNALDGAAVKYDSASKDAITLAGTSGTTITNVKAGVADTDAVNVSQLKAAGLVDAGGNPLSVVAYDTSMKDTITLAGTSGTTITNVKAGSIAAGSTDAVTGDQLNTTNANVTANTTAIAGLDTRVTQNATDIGSLNTNVAANTASIAGLDTRVTQNTTDIASLNRDVSSSATDLASAQAQLNALDGAAVKYDSASKDTITLAGTSGTTITNVKAGVADTDAVNVSQLKAAGLVDAGGNPLSVVAYDTSMKDTITLAGTSGTAITNVKAGSIAAGSTDAINGDQLNTTNANVASNTTAIASLDTRVTQATTDIGSLETNLASNTANLASAQTRLNELDGSAVKYSSGSKDTIVLAGASGTTISNVKAGVADTDAVNVSQLKQTGLVDANGNAVPSVTYDAGSNKSAVTFAGANGTQLKNVAAGTDDTDAVNVGQLKSAGIVDANGNALDVLAYDAGSNKDVITLKGTGGTLITNVKAGRLAADSTDAVNGAQLFALAGNTSDAYVADNGSGVKYSRTNDNGLTSDDAHAEGVGSTAVGYAATASANDALALGHGAQASFANSVALGAGSATTVGALANYAAFGLAAQQSSAGEVNVGNRQITGVAAGSADQDAVNVAQLKSVSSKIDDVGAAVAQTGKIELKYDDASRAKVTLGGTEQAHAPVTIANVANGTISADSTEAVNGSQLYSLQSQIDSSVANAAHAANIVAGDGTANEAAQAGGTHAVSVGSNASASGDHSAALGANATASAGNSTAIGMGATASHDNSVALGANSTTDRENSVSVGSVGGERQITNVAAGTQANDAVNLSQMQGAVAGGVETANAYTDARFNQAKRDSYAGTAAAMAIAGLPQATLPGRGMMAVAGSTYHGQSAVAMGVSALSESGRVAVKVTGSTDGHGDYGVTAGAGLHW